MRTVNALRNVSSQVVNVTVISLLTFIYRAVLIKTLGVEYVGFHAAIINLVAILSLTELGVSQSIAYFLYAPLQKRDHAKVSIIMIYLKKIYLVIGVTNILLSLLLLYFIPVIVSEHESINNYELYVFFSIYAISSIVPYFLGYKRILIIADQKNYKILPMITCLKIVDALAKITILYVSESYFLVLLVQLSLVILENVLVNRIIGKEYKDVEFNSKVDSLDRTEKWRLINKIRSMFYHKIGDVSLNSTDNLIINHFVGLSLLGMYSNYVMLCSLITTFLSVAFNSITSVIGNLLTNSSLIHVRSIFIIVFKACNLLFILSSVSFYFLSDAIISIWLGDKFIIDGSIKLALAINLFFLGVRIPLNIFKIAAGQVEKDRFGPIIQALINLVLSIYLAQSLGIVGVVIGTILSGLLVPMWLQPLIVYKTILRESIRNYVFMLIKILISYLIVFVYCGYIIDHYFKLQELKVDLYLIFFSFKYIMFALAPSFIFISLFLFAKAEISTIKDKLISCVR